MIRTHGLLAAAGYKSTLAAAPTEEWNPQELGVSVVRGLWNPVADPSSVSEASGNISQIDDLSGNDFHLIGFNNPNWNAATNTVEINSVTNEYLAAPMDAAPSVSVGHLFFYAQLLNTSDNFGRFIGTDLGENDVAQIDYCAPLMYGNVNNLRSGDGAGMLIITSLPSGYGLIEVRVEPAAVGIYRNGVLLNSDDQGSALNFESICVGRGWTNSFGASSNWRSMCIVEGILSTDNRQRIEGWMMQQVSDQASLPGGHPYKDTVFSDPV